jgi:hypothetical protein
LTCGAIPNCHIPRSRSLQPRKVLGFVREVERVRVCRGYVLELVPILGSFNPKLASLDFLLQYLCSIFNFQLSFNSAVNKGWLVGKHSRVALIYLPLGCSQTLYHEVGICLLLLIELILEDLHRQLGWIASMLRLDVQEPSCEVIVILFVSSYLAFLFVLAFDCILAALCETP